MLKMKSIKTKGRMVAGLLFLCLLMTTCFCRADRVFAAPSVQRTKSRVIHVVYDDSGSMVVKAGEPITKWSQARYALEVFAAMMSETDDLMIYPMTSYSYQDDQKKDKTSTWETKIQISGSTKPADRVDKINKLNGTDEGKYYNTPIETVIAAGDDLVGKSADEKWLIILTDGGFDHGDGKLIDPSETKGLIMPYAGKDEIRVAYVAIVGDSKKDPNNLINSGSDYFFPYLASDDDVLSTVTKVARTVFNLQTIDMEEGDDKNVSPDIPVSKLIIFAQGDAVSVGKIKIDGKELDTAHVSVNTEVSKNTKYKPNLQDYKNCKGKEAKVASGLKGTVVTYTAEDEEHPFPAGTYSFSCNSPNTEVYFEPGVMIVARLVDEAGNSWELGDDDSALSAGKKTVQMEMIDPLTGDKIDPSSSPLLKGADMSMIITDDTGNSVVYKDGDEVILQEGDVSIRTRAVFEGDLEKTSAAKTIHVKEAFLQVVFLSPEGYEMDITTLKTSEPLKVKVLDSSGKPLSDQEYDSMKYEVSGPNGLKWELEPDGNGEFTLIPSYADKNGMAAVDLSEGKITIIAETSADGMTRSGSASCPLFGAGVINLNLVLTMDLPDEVSWTNDHKVSDADDDEKKYMFDSSVLGEQKDAPYILIRAEVEDENGGRRPLSDLEWKEGLNSFHFNSKGIPEPMPAQILWKIVNIVCAQKLDFEVVYGEEPSTYRLYPSALTPVNLRPNNSELQVEMVVKLGKEITESGKISGVVSVKPQSILHYIGWLLAVIAALLLLAIFLFMELVLKKRFDRDLYPNTQPHLEKAGVPFKPATAMVSGDKNVRNRIWPPLKAEETRVKMDFPGYLAPSIYFHIVAGPNGTFSITDLETAFAPVADRVKFGTKPYKTAIKKQPVFDRNSVIKVSISRGVITGYVFMTFIKPDLKKKKKK